MTAWVTTEQIAVDDVVTELGSALKRHRGKFLALLRDSSVMRIVLEHRDRFCRFGWEYVRAALAARVRELVVVGTAEVDDDLVGDMTEILTSMWARLYGNVPRPTVPDARSMPPSLTARRPDGEV